MSTPTDTAIREAKHLFQDHQVSILMVANDLGAGGMERRMLELIKGLVASGRYQITLVLLEDRIEFKYIHDLPVRLLIFEKHSKFDLSPVQRLGKLIRELQPDIIHSWNPAASIYMAPTVIRRGYKLISSVIADAPAHVSSLSSAYLQRKLCYWVSDLILSNSEAGLAAYRAPRQKSACIYNGLDFNRFEHLKDAESLRREVFGPGAEKGFTVGMVAKFEDRKDHATLIDASVELAGRYPDYHLLLIGRGSLLEAMQQRVPIGLLGKKIHFLGVRSDVESLLQLIDVGVLTTNAHLHGEGISNSIIEYMAAGKPVVATRGGGTDEVVQEGYNGMLIDPFHKEQLIAALERLYLNREEAARLGKQAAVFVREKFNLKGMTEQFIRQYERLLATSNLSSKR